MIATTLQSLAVPLSDLQPDPRNARAHSARNLKAISDSLHRFGQQKPIVVTPDGVILAGNGTYTAAKALGWQELACTVFEGRESDFRAFAVADNRTAELAEWDYKELSTQLDDLRAARIGWTEQELDELEARAGAVAALETLQAAGSTTADELPLPTETRVKTGQLWRVGRHKLLCGDSTSPNIWQVHGLKIEEADFLWSDPPYGIGYVGRQKVRDALEGDHNLDAAKAGIEEAYRYLRKGGAVYTCSTGHELLCDWLTWCMAQGWWRDNLVWIKDTFVIGRKDYHAQHEALQYGWKPGESHDWSGDRKQSTVLQISRPRTSIEHPTMKPVELVLATLGNHVASKKQVCIDPFAGSGTTLVACDHLAISGYGIEIDPVYCEVILRRLEQKTGAKAEKIL